MLRLLVEVFATVLVQTLTILGLVLSWLPNIVNAALGMLRVYVSVTCLLYRGLAVWLGRPLRGLRIDLTRQPWRSLFAALLSMGSGAAIWAAMGWPITPRLLVISAIHGLIIAFIWDQMTPPNGQSIGR